MNWLAIILATIGQAVVGMVWYSKAGFAKQWMALAKITPSGTRKDAARAVATSMVASLVSSIVLAVLFTATGATTAAMGLQIVGLVWLGFIVTTSLNHVLFEKYSFKLFLLHAAHNLVSLAVAGLILTAWH